MHLTKSHLKQHYDLRKEPRHYLTEVLPAELIHGRRHFRIDAAAIADVSSKGLGLRLHHHINVEAGHLVTLAARIGGEVTTLSGTVRSVRQADHLGLSVSLEAIRPLLQKLDGELPSATVKLCGNGRAEMAGRVSVCARPALKWATREGVQRIDLSRVEYMDSAGVGMLLLLNERHGLKVERCNRPICRLLKFCGYPQLCNADCPSLDALLAPSGVR